MLLGIDHLVIAVDDPAAAAGVLADATGLTPDGGGRHEALGTANRLVWLGDSYLELIAVEAAALAADSWIGRPTLAALGSGGGLATWAIATDVIDADIGRLRSRGSDLPDPIPGERRRPDGATVRWRLAAPATLGPDRPPFLIEHDPGGAEWGETERRARRTASTARLEVLEIGVDDVAAATTRALRTLDLRFRPSLAGGGARDADIGPQRVRYRPRRGTAGPTTTVHLRALDRSVVRGQLDLLGCRWVIDG